MWRVGSWSWTGAKVFRGKEIIRNGWIKSKSVWRRRKKQKANARKPYSASWNGYARAQKAARQNPKRVYRIMKKCWAKMQKQWKRNWSFTFRTVRVWEMK